MAISKEDEIGALWERTSGRGARFLSGHVEINGQKQDVVIFENGFKEGRQPDWRVYISRDRQEQPAPRQASAPQRYDMKRESF